MNVNPESTPRSSNQPPRPSRSGKKSRRNKKAKNELTFTPSRSTFDVVPVDLRARIRTNPVDFIRNQARAYNKIRVPHWDVWPLESKVPDIRNRVWPIDSVYFTRGKVGQRLHFKPPGRTPKMTIYDPQGTLAASKSYSALHDPHAKKYFQKPEVQKVLLRNDLINENNEVLCSIKEYNQFRRYLSTFPNETVDERLHQQADLKQFHKDVQLPFTKYVKHKEHPAVVQARRSQKDVREERQRLMRHEIERKVQGYEARMKKFKALKQERLLHTIAEVQAKEARAKKRRLRMQVFETQMRRDILHNAILDMAQATTNRQDYAQMMLNVKRDVQKERAIARATFEQHDAELMEVVEEAVKRQRKQWSIQYEKRLNAASQTMDYLKAAAEAKSKREKFLSRKYYDLWRLFLTRTRNRVYSPGHTSTFRVENDMKRMVEWLDKETGYDLVMAVVRKTFDQGLWNIRAHFAKSRGGQASRRNTWSRKDSKRTSLKPSKTNISDKRSKKSSHFRSVSSRSGSHQQEKPKSHKSHK